MNRKYLYYIAAALWGIPGVIIALKLIPGVPAEFTASFYSGLGPMLVYAACRFVSSEKRLA